MPRRQRPCIMEIKEEWNSELLWWLNRPDMSIRKHPAKLSLFDRARFPRFFRSSFRLHFKNFLSFLNVYFYGEVLTRVCWQKPKGLGLTCLFGKGWGIDVNGQSWQIPPIGPPISLCDASWSPWRYDVFGANQHLSKGWRPGWLPLDGNPAPVWSYHDKGESSRLQALLHILQLRRRTKDQDLFQVQERGIHHGRSDSGHLHWRWKGGCDGFYAQASTASSVFAGMPNHIFCWPITLWKG